MKNKNKSILFIEFLPTTAANHLTMLIKGFIQQYDCKVVLLCQKGSLLAKELKKTKVVVYEVNYVELNLHKPTTYFNFLELLIFIFFIIFRHKINIIHSHRLNWAYLGVIPSLILKIPLVVHIVIIENLTSGLQKLLLKINNERVHYLAVSKNTLVKFKQLSCINNIKISYHYGGLFLPDMQKMQQMRIPFFESKKNKIIIGMVSRLDQLKGVDIFIEAAAILLKKYKNLYFLHVGDIPYNTFQDGYYEMCLQRIDNLNIQKSFKFLLYNDEVLAYYKYFYLTVTPTFKDTLLYVNLESSFNKIPQIFTDVDGVMETSQRIFNCCIPYPPSPVLLADKIEELLIDKQRYNKLKEQVYSDVLRRFNAEKNARKLMQFYNNL
jgi:glycosyltransferase involved in cell wall biosynthesis